MTDPSQSRSTRLEPTTSNPQLLCALLIAARWGQDRHLSAKRGKHVRTPLEWEGPTAQDDTQGHALVADFCGIDSEWLADQIEACADYEALLERGVKRDVRSEAATAAKRIIRNTSTLDSAAKTLMRNHDVDALTARVLIRGTEVQERILRLRKSVERSVRTAEPDRAAVRYVLSPRVNAWLDEWHSSSKRMQDLHEETMEFLSVANSSRLRAYIGSAGRREEESQRANYEAEFAATAAWRGEQVPVVEALVDFVSGVELPTSRSFANQLAFAFNVARQLPLSKRGQPEAEMRQLEEGLEKAKRREESLEAYRVWLDDRLASLARPDHVLASLSRGAVASADDLDEALSRLRVPVRLDRISWPESSDATKIAITVPTKHEVDAARTRETRQQTKARTGVKPLTASEYSRAVASLCLAVLDVCARAGRQQDIVLNAWADTINPATGHDERVCLLSVAVASASVMSLQLDRVDPVSCIRGLNATVSRSPAKLSAVRPVVDFDKSDERFVDSVAVAQELESRPNLLELSPAEFEALIENLFAAMGLDTKLTRASRDGGVDCVAYDHRPVLGGKIVIQAKRYAKTVGVSAVRDLYGATHNEGASKGVIVTTSKYGKGSYDFASNKPLELIDGPGLLYLLKEHAGIDARIEVPDDWDEPTSE